MYAVDTQDVIAAFKGAGALLRKLQSIGGFTRYTDFAPGAGPRSTVIEALRVSSAGSA